MQVNCEEIAITADQWYDLPYLQALMLEYQDTTEPFYGKNDNGEEITISINSDNITLVTYQHNHWVRKNVYWKDGTVEELFDGRY